MSSKTQIGLVFTDVVSIYKHFEQCDHREQAIKAMNDGRCGVIASLCAYIIRKKFGIEGLTMSSHALHQYITYDGKDYDTLFPEGYPTSAVEMWLLKEMGESQESCSVPVGSEVNKGFYDWGFVYILKSMCKRWGVQEPDYLPEYVIGAEQYCTNPDRKIGMIERYDDSLEIPLADHVIPNMVMTDIHQQWVSQ